MSSSKKAKGAVLPLVIVFAALALLSVLFLVVLKQLDVLPNRYFAAVCVLFVVVLLILFLLLRSFKASFRCILGVILTLVYVCALLYGGFALNRMNKALDNVSVSTDTIVEVSEMVVYVRTADTATTLNDVASYSFGVMSKQNVDVTEAAVAQLNSELSTSIATQGFDSPAALVQGLLDGDVDAILFNSVFFDLLSSNEKYADLNTRVRALTTLKVETEVDVKTETKEEKPSATITSDDENIVTIMLTGNDDYGTVTTTGRSDVNILAVINTATKQVALISTPRDYYVEFPNSWGELDKLTHAACYGIDNATGTLEMLYDVEIDYYFRVNFSGFENIIDAIGGITLVNDIAFTSDASAEYYYFPEGEITMNGSEALSYVRCRHAFTDGDNARGRHQMMVIKAVISKLMSADMLLNLDSLLSAVEGCFATDMPTKVMKDLAKSIAGDSLSSWNIVQYAVSGWNSSAYSWGAGEELSVVIPYQASVDAAKEVIRQVFDGETINVPEVAPLQ